MRRRMLIAGALVWGAGTAVAENREGSVVHLTGADAGRLIHVPVGSEIRARLAQPSGTDERWELRGDPHLRLIGMPQSQVSYGTGMGRGREFRLFRLRVVRAGRFPLLFGLLPPLPAANQAPSRRIVIDVDAPPPERHTGWRPIPDDGQDRGGGPDTIEPLVEGDAGRWIDVPVGQVMTIALPSNASTGYRWQIASTSNVAIHGAIEEQRPRQASIGSGGTSVARFRVLRPGPAGITMLYLPPGGGTAARRLAYRFRGI